jgi:hypothetical protein
MLPFIVALGSALMSIWCGALATARALSFVLIFHVVSD